MPLIRLTVKSTLFADELKRRAASFRSKQQYVRLVAPDTLRWWYWLEFGTAGRQDPAAPERSKWSGKYPIDPVSLAHGNIQGSLSQADLVSGLVNVLSWPGEGGEERIYRAHVNHPGIKPRAFIRKSMDDVNQIVSQRVMQALVASGIHPDGVASGLEDGMKLGVEIITKSLEEQTKEEVRSDKWGKGKTAGDLFSEQIQIKINE